MSHFVKRESCPVCGVPGAQVIYRVSYQSEIMRGLLTSQYEMQGQIDWRLLGDGEYIAMHCPTCDLVYQQAVPDNRLLDAIYTEMISADALAQFERALLTFTNVEKITGELARLFRLTGKEPADITFLDYGFGHGRWARIARGMGARVFGTEIGADKARLAGQLGIEMLEDTAIDEMQFDIVHTEQVLEHLVYPGQTFARLARASRCLFKVAIPVRHDLITLLQTQGLPRQSAFAKSLRGERVTSADEAFSALQPLEHLNAYSPTTMAYMAQAHGLKLVGRSRLGAVSVDMMSIKALSRSMLQLGQMAAKAILQPDRGYYLFLRASTRMPAS